MPVARVTLSDVARRAGVSKTTASYVTSGRRDMRISAEAEARVHAAAKELGYRPSLLARGLRTQLTHTVGFISDVVAVEPYAGDLIRGAMLAAREHDTLLLVGETGGDEVVQDQLARSMIDRGVDGIVYATMYTRAAQLPPALAGQPVVLVNCTAPGVPGVVPDERAAGHAAARVLLDAGHRDRIVLVGETPRDVMAARDRRAGLTAELAAAGARLAGHVACRWWPDGGHAGVQALLAGGTRPSALVCLNDRIAMGACQALTERGLRVPSEVSVVSFDDSDLARWLRPALTSIAIPHLDLGRRGVELLLAAPGGRPRSERLAMPVRHRDSVAAPAG